MKKVHKIFIQVHKISGSLLSLIFVAWFISGIVLIFDGFPHASRNQRFLHLDEFTPRQFESIKPPSNDFKGRVVLELTDGKPVYRVLSGRKAQKTFDATTLKPISYFTSEHAQKLSESFNGHPVKQIKKINDFDQWIPWSYYKPLFPLYKCYMSDPLHTVIYVSEKTGEIVQETDRKERWSARFGAIPHWVYFKQLRLAKDAWRWVVIILSVFGMFMSVTGIYSGIVRLKKRRHKGLSPYKKFWCKWHHLLGFFFGLFVFTFILSGFFSVANVPDWLAGVNSSEKVRISWDEKLDLEGHQNTAPINIFNALTLKTGVRKIEWTTVFGQPQYKVFYDNYQKPEMYCLQNGNVRALQSFSMQEIEKQAKAVLGELSFTIKEQPVYDNYYSPSAMLYLPQPAYKIEIEDAGNTWLYIDPANGEQVRSLTKNTRMRRWLYRFLHTFDIPILKKYDWLRKTILIVLSLAGLVISLTGLVVSVKWFKRTFRKNIKKQIT